MKMYGENKLFFSKLTHIMYIHYTYCIILKPEGYPQCTTNETNNYYSE